MSTITKNTGISISLAISLLGGVFWLSSIYYQASSNAQDISEIKKSHDMYLQNARDINKRLGRIEGRLGID